MTASSAITVTCANTTPYNIGLNAGSGAGSGAGLNGLTRYMSGAGSNTGTARFNLYQAAEGALRGNTQAWTLWAEQGRGRRR